MRQNDLDSLCAEITAFLRSSSIPSTDRAPLAQGIAFWYSRKTISTVEIEVLGLLADEPRNAEDVARHLSCDLGATQQLLEAFAAIGLVERHGERYCASEPTRSYLWALREGRLDGKE